MVQLSRGHACEGISKGKDNFKEGMNINLEYNELTDVMFADLRPMQEGSHVTVIDIGDQIGFCGQVQVRVDLEKQIFYGLTIQNYSGFKRRLQWRYRMLSIQAALRFLINTLMAGLRIEQNGHHGALTSC
jgi:hypothetical protein